MANAKARPKTGTGAELAKFYADKAAEAGVILEHDDTVLITQAAATVDLIAELQTDLDANGAMLTTAAGTVKVNPASVEVRQQRLTLSRLSVLIDRRIREAVAGGAMLHGGQPGPRGVYGGTGGDGAPNSGRNAAAAARRGRGKAAR
ncbi:hypothetical protein [Nocardia nova]|uniref:hypothetical protein n=1 Tax=Nocardia nova TaxID=37330 RepID=UPI000CEA51F4|nr:hypothetical protein [Nocardia nova]PPJ34404.1 hypothetical protein C5E41_02320 [Nocardia nova]